MAMSWTVPQSTVDLVKKALQSQLGKAAIPSFAQINWEANELSVKIDKAGKSEFRLALVPDGSNVKIVETRRDVAFMHKPFVSKVESFVKQVMTESGIVKA